MDAKPVVDRASFLSLRRRIDAFLAESVACNPASRDDELLTNQVAMLLSCFQLDELAELASLHGDDQQLERRPIDACLLACEQCAQRCARHQDRCACADACREYVVEVAASVGVEGSELPT